MPIGPERAAVDECVRERVDDLLARGAEQAGRDGRRGDSNQQHVIEADAVEAVIQREHALNLVRLDHRREHVGHDEALRRRRGGPTAQIVGDREDAAQVVRGMPPFGREPGVVEVEPADRCADIECGRDRIERVGRAGNARAVRELGAWHDGP